MDEQFQRDKSPFSYVSIIDPASYEAFAKEHLLIPLQEETGVKIPALVAESRLFRRILG